MTAHQAEETTSFREGYKPERNGLVREDEARGKLSLFCARAIESLLGVKMLQKAHTGGEPGVHARPILQPRLYAKALRGDGHTLVVSSQNWPSVSSSHADSRREIGAFVEPGKIADTFVRSLSALGDRRPKFAPLHR